MPIAKREAELKSLFTAALPQSFVVQLMASAGSPDRAITGYGRTTFWEFKHATPGFDSPGLQELTCMRLAMAGHCRYVLWMESASGVGKRTLIVHPKSVHDKTLTPEAFCVGYDMRWLVEQVKKAHGV